jgi:diguanylate cyclase (GGDEF)-like protein
MTPFAHYAGAFMTYDIENKILFSGDVFGGVSNQKTIYADEEYLEKMSIFHENYIPSSDFLRPIMKELLEYDIDCICPQHGSVIRKNWVKKSIDFLYQLEFYNTPRPIYNTFANPDEIDFQYHLVQILIRLKQFYSDDLIKNTFLNTPIAIGLNPVAIKSDLKGYTLWNRFFDILYAKRGDNWLNTLETLVNRISRTYKISMPNIYELKSIELEEKNRTMTRKYSSLESSLNDLTQKMTETQDQLMRCSVTGLYNKTMARKHIQTNIDRLKEHAFLLNLDIDQLIEINRTYSNKMGDETMNILKYIINNNLEEDEMMFRGKGSSFLILKEIDDKRLVKKRAEFFRNLVQKSDQFIQPVTISTGIIALSAQDMIHPDQQINDWFFEVEKRLELAKNKGKGFIVFENKEDFAIYKNRVLLVDEEQVNINLITHYFKEEAIRVFQVKNPLEAMHLLETQTIDLIISEINLSKLDGFSLKKQLNEQTKYANIPFIFLSHMKNESLIERANRLNVDYFIKKPFYMVELLGIVERAVK